MMNSKKVYPVETKETVEAKKITKRIWKNMIVLTLAFMLNYSAYNGLFFIQSSLHREEGMGTTGASIMYITSTLTCLFLAPLFVQILGHKGTIVAAFITFFIWIAANGIGTWGSVITGSIVNGLFTSPLWAAEGSYTTELAKLYAHINTDVTAERMCVFFFGIFSIQFGISALISDTIASSVLINTQSANFTKPPEEDIAQYCGLNDCPWYDHNNTYFDEPPSNTVWTLIGIYLVISLSAILVAIIFLDSLPVLQEMVTGKNTKITRTKAEICTALLSCLKLMKYYRLWLFLPIDWYLATSYAFRIADFNGSWVTCAAGIWMVGLINIPGHITKIPTALITGYVSKKLGRLIPIFVSITAGLIGLLILAIWPVSGEETWVLFVLSIIFAMHVSILDTIITAVHGIAFFHDTTAVFACYNFFWSAFSAIPFGYSYYICSDTKLYILMAAFVACFISYFCLEWDLHKKNENEQTNDTDSVERNPSTIKADMDSQESNRFSYQEEKYTKF